MFTVNTSAIWQAELPLQCYVDFATCLAAAKSVAELRE